MPENIGGESLEGSFANPFLNTVAPEDREVVGKYITEWDKNISRRFNEKDQEFRPYRELGSVEELQAAKQLYELIDSDPKYVYDQIGQALGLSSQEVKKAVEEGSEEQDEFSKYLSPLEQKLEQQQKILEALARQTMEVSTSTKEKEEDEVLDNYLYELHEEHGDFDEDYVLLKMHQGLSAEDAIEAFQEAVGSFGGGNSQQQRFAPLPPALSGGGVPSNQKSLGEMDNKDIQGLVANIMAGVNHRG